MAEDRPRGDIDWEEIERSPEFQELVHKRKSFVVPGTIFFLTWYMGFILLVAYAEGFMSERVYEGLTVGYCLALTQFVMVLVLGLLYLSKSTNVFDPLRKVIVDKWSRGDGGTGNGHPAGTDGNGVGARAATPTAAEVER
jgi:uncharacterized membrane protein (DUF485 family)